MADGIFRNSGLGKSAGIGGAAGWGVADRGASREAAGRGSSRDGDAARAL